MICRLCNALNSLPETQGRRVEAHFILGMSKADIARAEGVAKSRVSESIERSEYEKIFEEHALIAELSAPK